jgi:DNA-binding HxlR family transcriptional regulator
MKTVSRNRQTTIPQEDIDLCESMTAKEEAVVREIMSRVTDKWCLWALSELTEYGPLRFSRILDRVVGVSQKSLTATLRNLERDGLITRTVTAQVPVRVDYEATALGHAMIQKVHPLWQWAARNHAAFAQARKDYDRVHARRVAGGGTARR